MSIQNIFVAAKGFKKEDLKTVAEEIGEIVPATITIAQLKNLITKSEEFQNDPDFVKEILLNTIEERKQKEEKEIKQEEERKQKEEERKQEEEKRKQEELDKARQFELEMAKLNQELELARINQREIYSDVNETSSLKRKFTLPKLQFRQFGDDLKDWLPFWSQFQHIDKDEEIAPEDKFQYLIQATVVGSRAREVVESFPPTGANYFKAVESLKARFGRDDLLVEIYVRELIKLIISAQMRENFSITSLYDKLESYMRALETLGVTTEKCGSILYPMVESCFPADFLKAWNRNNNFNSSTDAKERLNNLMLFLKSEVEGEERISLAMSGFGLIKNEDKKIMKVKKSYSVNSKNRIPTAAGLLATSMQEVKKACVFCGGKHPSSDCFSAQKMTLTEKQNILKEKGCCFTCLASGHRAKFCRAFLRCIICGKKHLPLMCESLDSQNKITQKKIETKPTEGEVTLSNFNKSPMVFLQTIKVRLISDKKVIQARAILDSGSQRSYILSDIAKDMDYAPIREETVFHSLFGGIVSEKSKHRCYKIRLGNLNDTFACNFEAVDQPVICENIMPVNSGPWIEELRKLKINLTDLGENPQPIHILIGADVLGRLMTGQRKVLSNGLVAIETYLGWTLLGKVPQQRNYSSSAMLVTSLFVKEANISDLWELDLIGIKDPVEKITKEEQELLIKEHFLKTIRYTDEGRYEVHLPWRDDCVPLPDNLELAKRRLQSTTVKVLSDNLYEDYENIFLQWLDEKIIEDVPLAEIGSVGNYLPHRPVLKKSSSTTPIRPVFDASARIKGHPSLNQCLQNGPNLIELIPDILLRFREKKIGVMTDIKKAFLQIGICKKDRDYLRFLWWERKDCQKLRMFRHTRVVFGVKSSPFLLGAVLKYHINKFADCDPFITTCLSKGLYVDNLIISVNNEQDLQRIITGTNNLLKNGGFELHDWVFSSAGIENTEIFDLLGLQWNTNLDVLTFNLNWLQDMNLKTITKRTMLSIAHKVFDPFGFASPVMLCPKLMLQKTWKISLGWDEEITETLREEFLRWFRDLEALKQICVPRWIKITSEGLKNCSLHIFCDASKDAYAAVIFLIHSGEYNEVFFLSSRSRVAPLKAATIPRLELLAALVGVRLARSVTNALDWKSIKCYYWSDSTTVLTWINREENWSVFVKNRVEEIRKFSQPSSWGFITGEENPADLPSRGCRASHLIKIRWWEGPLWMKYSIEKWPVSNIFSEVDEEEINKEKAKTSCLLNNTNEVSQSNWYYRYFSSYEKIVRLVGWILRFMHNCFVSHEKIHGELTTEEFQKAEKRILKMIQQESFVTENDVRLKTLETFRGDDDIIRVKTRIIYRKDDVNFLYPVVLPAKHEVVKRLILHIHIRNCHAGVQTVLNKIREKYWILNSRKTVRSVLSKCIICQRFTVKNFEAASSPLPEDRVRDAAVFQITGVDMAGPLFLKNNQKGWIIIFTCAVYRAVHFELVTSASTDAFLMALRRFIARRGRPTTIYSDNGTNFVGAANYLKSINWQRVQIHGVTNSIQWKFNPPTASWWGGWWERIIRILKDLLKRVLRKSCLSHEEMLTVLADCESVINSRPLTYISEHESLRPISPSMFLQDAPECKVPDIDAVEEGTLNRRLKYRQTLQKDLRNRFRSEYLGLLVQAPKRKSLNPIKENQIVLVGSDNRKRIDWPLGKVIEIIPGKDNEVRLVRVQISQSTLLRPVQRIYPLEIDTNDGLSNLLSDEIPSNHSRKTHVSNGRDFGSTLNKILPPDPVNVSSEVKVTRSGRQVNAPKRLDL